MIDLKNNAFKPISFWSWNGVMEERELRRQIRDFRDKNFGGFFIHSRAGRLIPYMGAQWMSACRIAVDEAEKVGLDVWLYDEDGWPSGFAGGLVNGKGKDFWARELEFTANRPTNPLCSLLSAYKKIGDGFVRTDFDDEDAELFCSERCVPTYVDLMNPAVTTEFINVTHEVYKNELGKYFEKVIKGIFTDEPQLLGDFPWSPGIAKAYKDEYGEDILDSLWLLNIRDGGYELKYKYRKLTNRLFRDSYVRPINEWCRKNGLVFTGHFGCEDGLVEQICSNGGVMPLYCEMDMPGIDHLGNRFAPINLMKQVSGVANRKGLPYILSESFGCSGWNVSFKELAAVAGWQGVFGINLLCMHLSAYTLVGRRKRDYPAFFSYQEPWWERMGELNEYFGRLCAALSDGKRTTYIAVIHPIGSAWCLNGEDAKFISAEFRTLQDNLNDLHLDYDLIDESELPGSEINTEGIRAGNINYKVIIVPETFTLAEPTVQILDEFTRNGGILYFIGKRPQSVEGDFCNPAVPRIDKLPANEIQNTRNILQKVFRAEPIDRPFALLDSRLENETSGLVCRYVSNSKESKLFCFNKNDNLSLAVLRHRGRHSVFVFDLFANVKTPLKTVFDGENTYAEISVPPKSGKMFVVAQEANNINAVGNSAETEIPFSEISLLSPNCLTLDTGRISLFDEEYSETKNIVNSADEIYRRISKSDIDAPLKIKYTFRTEFRKKMPTLYLAFEKNRYVTATINGSEVNCESEWFIDRGICKFNISRFVKNGENTIELRYIIPNTHTVNDLRDKFESERNRFFYSVEPENIYLIGDFDVACYGKIAGKPNVTVVTPKNGGKTFVLTDLSSKMPGNLTEQQMWFYRGNVLYKAEADYKSDGKYYVSTVNLSGILATVLIDGKEAGSIISDYDRLEITKYLKPGKNIVEIKLYGSNRNLMGPHHHITGEPCFVGPSTFRGLKGFEDFVTPEIKFENTYTDNYSFVPFGISKIRLTVETVEPRSADI